ncbi:SAM-dependent methyltransferase, partial [Amycolatopsis sp. SID8362]|nr:SAM-dependent methyltransferase [Amycolatopsis sp. SID8362]NED41732.1 SAM-dependent methyltransferase [Amycolatopsis sp. SID8362]
LHRALAGRVGESRQLLESADGVVAGDTVLRRFSAAGLRTELEAAGLDVTLLQGDRVISDLVAGDVREEELADFELAAAGTPALREIASRLHAVARPRS